MKLISAFVTMLLAAPAAARGARLESDGAAGSADGQARSSQPQQKRWRIQYVLLVAGLVFSFHLSTACWPSAAQEARTIEGTWTDAASGRSMTITRRSDGWEIAGLAGRHSIRGATDRAISIYYWPNAHVREDWVLQLSVDGLTLEGRVAAFQAQDLALIHGWTSMSWRRAR